MSSSQRYKTKKSSSVSFSYLSSVGLDSTISMANVWLRSSQPGGWRAPVGIRWARGSRGCGGASAGPQPSPPGTCSTPNLLQRAEQEARTTMGPVRAAQPSPAQGVVAARSGYPHIHLSCPRQGWIRPGDTDRMCAPCHAALCQLGREERDRKEFLQMYSSSRLK